MTAVNNITAYDAPEFVSILLCCLLFKLGGQITLTLGEIEDIHAQFPSIRFALEQHPDADPRNERITATLRSRDHVENDRPTFPPNGGRMG